MPGPRDYERLVDEKLKEIKQLALDIIDRKRAIRKIQMEILSLDEEG